MKIVHLKNGTVSPGADVQKLTPPKKTYKQIVAEMSEQIMRANDLKLMRKEERERKKLTQTPKR